LEDVADAGQYVYKEEKLENKEANDGSNLGQQVKEIHNVDFDYACEK